MLPKLKKGHNIIFYRLLRKAFFVINFSFIVRVLKNIILRFTCSNVFDRCPETNAEEEEQETELKFMNMLLKKKKINNI